MSACTRTGGQGSGRKGGGRGQTATVAAAAAAATDWIELRSAGSESSGNGSSPGSASPYSRYHYSHVKKTVMSMSKQFNTPQIVRFALLSVKNKLLNKGSP